MEFRVEAEIPRAASEVWAVLVDIPKIAGCIPGCEEVEERTRLADYSAVLKQKLGPFKVALPATIAVLEVREPNWIQASASGTERFTGTRIDVTLRMDLRDIGPGSSHMVAECDMQVAGKLASLGYSVIKKKAEDNFMEFRARLLKVLEECPAVQVQVQEIVAGECVEAAVIMTDIVIAVDEGLLDNPAEVRAETSVETSVERPVEVASEGGVEPQLEAADSQPAPTPVPAT